jgi:hypothetical protein
MLSNNYSTRSGVSFTPSWRSQPDGEAEQDDSELAGEEFVLTPERS